MDYRWRCGTSVSARMAGHSRYRNAHVSVLCNHHETHLADSGQQIRDRLMIIIRLTRRAHLSPAQAEEACTLERPNKDSGNNSVPHGSVSTYYDRQY